MIKNINIPDVEFSNKFDRQLRNASDEIKEAFLETLVLFVDDPHNSFLRNHALKERFAGYRSIDITGDWRAVFKETTSGERTVFTFYMLGTHKELYGENA